MAHINTSRPPLRGNRSINIDSPFKCLTLNVRGLLNRNKRAALFASFQKEKYDFVSLQETHVLKPKILAEITRQWPGHLHVSAGTGRGKGLITLFNKSFSETDISELLKPTEF